MSFIRHSGDMTVAQKQMFGGSGEPAMRQILNGADEMFGKGRVFNHAVLAPGAEIGWHVHKGDGETYYILKGEGEYNDNGVMTTLRAGDTAFVDDGEGHSIKNTGSDTLEFIALILYS